MSHTDQDRIHQLLNRLDRVRLESEDIRAKIEQIRGINVEPVRISHGSRSDDDSAPPRSRDREHRE